MLLAGHIPPASSRYAPYSTERPSYEQPSSRRRYSQTLPREYHRPPSPSQYSLRSPPIAGRQPPIYAQESYPSYPPPSYARGTRRPSYTEERRPSRQESIRYPAPIPYGSSIRLVIRMNTAEEEVITIHIKDIWNTPQIAEDYHNKNLESKLHI